MEEVLREILAADKTILSRRDDLLAALDKKVPGNLRRDYAPIERAIKQNVGELFFVGESDKDATKEKVADTLKGMQEARINFVIETFAKALDWDKIKTPEAEDFSKTFDDEISEVENKPASTGAVQLLKKAKTETPPPLVQAPPSQKFTPPQPVQTPPPSPPVQTSSDDKTKKFLIGGICILALALAISMSSNSSNNNPPAPQTSQPQQVQQTQPQETQATQNTPPPEDTSYLNARSELSLNGMDLDISVDAVKRVLGKPNKVENRDGYERYFYDTIEMAFNKSGKLDGIVTDDPKFKTLRGLHVGSTYSDVVNKYGSGSSDMNQGDLILHEYSFTSLDGKQGLLRFAVKKSTNVVNYISVRIIEEPPKQNNTSNTDKNAEQAAQAFLSYHEAITNRNFSAAFNLFTEDRKENMNYNVQAFAKGYADTLRSEITDLRLVSSSANHVVMDYVLDARDRAGGNRVLYQQFKGQVEMVKVGGEWKIASTQSKKIKEVMER